MLDNVAFGIIISIIFISLVVLFCVLLIKLYINKIKNYTKLIYQKDIEFQKTLNATILETQEQVLNNISADLHDDAGQQLTYINFFIENFKLDSPELAERVEPISEAVYNLSNTIRSISHSLNNQQFSNIDLRKAIKAEVLRLKKNNGVTINYIQEEKALKQFNTNEKIVIYRIFQEVVNNILKHSSASHIEVVVKESPFFEICISDDGKGFDYENTIRKNNSLGLKNIIKRAEIINFDISIKSRPGKGTKILLTEKKIT